MEGLTAFEINWYAERRNILAQYVIEVRWLARQLNCGDAKPDRLYG